MAQPTAVLDIGSSKVVCVIGESDADGQVALYGVGLSEHRGLRRRAFLDESGLRMAIQDAVQGAQDNARRRIRQIVVGVPAPMTQVFCKTAEVEITGKEQRVSQDDIHRLIEASLDFLAPDKCIRIHSTPVLYSVDDVTHNDVPLGMQGATLSGQVCHVFMNEEFAVLVENTLGSDIAVSQYVDASLAEGLFVIPREERVNAAVLVDVGCYHTDVSIFKNASAVFRRIIDVGGNHFSSDIMYGLDVDQASAESLKRRYVFGLDYHDSVESARRSDGALLTVEHDAVQYIIESRATELARLIKDVLEQAGLNRERLNKLYIMGGGFIMMRGSKEFMQSALDMNISSDMPSMPMLNTPNYASTFGVLNFIYHTASGDNPVLAQKHQNRVLNKLIQFLIK